MSHVVRIYEHGAPSVLRYEEESVGPPAAGQVRIRQEAIGLNFADILFRTGTFEAPTPFVPGFEAAGVVDAVGPDVTEVKAGDRVAYYLSPGACADVRLIDPSKLVILPDTISFKEAAAVMTKGLTAWALTRRAHRVEPGQFVLVHAAAGGVGTLVSRWAKSLGATVIATVGSDKKVETVRQGGIEHVISLERHHVSAAISEITGGRGVDVVYDGVDQATFELSLGAVRPGGTIVRFGSASGASPTPDPANLASRSVQILSLRTSDYLPTRAALEDASNEVFAAVRNGLFGELPITQFPLADVVRAHEELQSRRTTGAVVLIP